MENKPSQQYHYLSTKGWKKVKALRTEPLVEYKGKFYTLLEGKEHKHSVQNIIQSPPVSLSVGNDLFASKPRINAKYLSNERLTIVLLPHSVVESK